MLPRNWIFRTSDIPWIDRISIITGANRPLMLVQGYKAFQTGLRFEKQQLLYRLDPLKNQNGLVHGRI